MSIEQQMRTGTPVEWLVSQGKISGLDKIHKFGKIDDVDRVDPPIPVWSNGSLYTFLNDPATLYISSSDDTDTCPIDIQGLDENWELQTESGVVLTGQTQKEVPGLWRRVFRSQKRGSSVQAGDYYIAVSDAAPGGVPADASIKAVVPASDSQTLMAIYTIPAGYYGLMKGFYASIQRGSLTSGSVDLRVRARLFEEVFVTKEYFNIGVTGGKPFQYNFPIPVRYEEKTDIMLEVADVSADNMAVSGGFDILLVKKIQEGQFLY